MGERRGGWLTKKFFNRARLPLVLMDSCWFWGGEINDYECGSPTRAFATCKLINMYLRQLHMKTPELVLLKAVRTESGLQRKRRLSVRRTTSAHRSFLK